MCLRFGRPRHGGTRAGRPESAPLKDFGGKLYDAVFQGEVRDRMSGSLIQTRAQGVGLRLRLRLTDTPQLAGLPWEFLYIRRENRFLAWSSRTPVVRYLDLPDPPRPVTVTGPLRLLVMISSPTNSNYPALDVEREWAALTGALAGPRADGRVVVERLTANMSALRQRLRREEFHVFHFMGHGGYRSDWRDGVLIMEDDSGRDSEVTGEELGALLTEHDATRLAVLNACEGARSDAIDPFAGTAQSLIQQGLPAVVAMQFEITDTAAITFARELYGAIADGYPLDAALAEARGAIRDQGNPTEWATPVLYSRAPDLRLFDLPRRAAARPTAPAGTPASTPPRAKNQQDERDTTTASHPLQAATFSLASRPQKTSESDELSAAAEAASTELLPGVGGNQEETGEQAQHDAEEAASPPSGEQAQHDAEEAASPPSGEQAQHDAEEAASPPSGEQAQHDAEEAASPPSGEQAQHDAEEAASPPSGEQAQHDAEEAARRQAEAAQASLVSHAPVSAGPASGAQVAGGAEAVGDSCDHPRSPDGQDSRLDSVVASDAGSGSDQAAAQGRSGSPGEGSASIESLPELAGTGTAPQAIPAGTTSATPQRGQTSPPGGSAPAGPGMADETASATGSDVRLGQERRPGRRNVLKIWAAGAAVVVVAATVILLVISAPRPSSSPGPSPSPATTVRVFSADGFGFNNPSAIADDGSHVWVVNAPLSSDGTPLADMGSVTELNASNGSLVRVLSAGSYAFNDPTAIASDGTHVWVANDDGNSVTELNASNGSLVRVLSAESYAFNSPAAIASDDTHVWVVNWIGNSVTELNASNGSLVRVLSAGSYAFNGPDDIADDGTHVWVANYDGKSVTELNASNGSLVRVLSAESYAFNDPAAIASDDTHVWVANDHGKSVTELNASNGSLVQVLSAGSYAFNSPAAIASDGTHVWVGNNPTGSGSVTELNAGDGRWVRTLSAASYGFYSPSAITVNGTQVWVAGGSNNSVTEMSVG